MALSTQDLTVAYTDQVIVNGVTLSIPEGKITALIGPNGSGKSTLIKAIARILKPKSGAVYLDGKAIHQLPTKEVARQMAILPQTPTAPEGTTVKQLVSLGRFPYQSGWSGLGKRDQEWIDWALEVTGLTSFQDQVIDQLSGGQRQRAWIAMALAQETEYLLLDEPTTYLDLAHQHEILQLLEKLNNEQKRTIVMVIHELNHASRFAHHIACIHQGRLYKEGTPNEVITPEVLEHVFRIKADFLTDPRTGMPLCLPYDVIESNAQ